MFAKKARTPLSGPESLNPGVIHNKPETSKLLREVEPVLIERKSTVERGVHRIEAVRHMQVGASDQAPTLGVRMMKGVPVHRVESVKEEVEVSAFAPVAPAEQVQKFVAPEAPKPVEALVKTPAESVPEAKVHQLNEARSRRLLEDDAHRQIEQAFDPGHTLEAKVIEFPVEQPIPDLTVVATEHVIAARAGVEAALQSQAEAARKSESAQRDAESLKQFLAQHHEQRRAAA